MAQNKNKAVIRDYCSKNREVLNSLFSKYKGYLVDEEYDREVDCIMDERRYVSDEDWDRIRPDIEAEVQHDFKAYKNVEDLPLRTLRKMHKALKEDEDVNILHSLIQLLEKTK